MPVFTRMLILNLLRKQSAVSYSKWRCVKYLDLTTRCLYCTRISKPPVPTEASSPEKDNLEYLHKIRNIGIMAHIDAGKTTTTERMLFYSGFTHRLGEVHDGDTVMDYMEQERNRGITITSAAITFPWNDNRVNLVDTPGHVDFTMEVERALRVLDGAVAIFDASAGVEAQSLTVWRQADSYQVPRVCYLNKMDKSSANLSLCLNSIKEKLHATTLLLQLPILQNNSFCGIIDILTMRKFIWSQHKSKDYGRNFFNQQMNSDDDMWDQAFLARCELTDTLTDLDLDLAEYVLEKESIENVPTELLMEAIRRVTLKQDAVPVLLGSSYKNIGVQPLLDAVVDYLPSPVDIVHETVKLYAPSLCAMAFKIIHDKQRGGMLTFLRIYSGHLEQGQRIFNVNSEITERIGRVMIAFADEFKEVGSIKSGNIVVVTGLKETRTGDTLVANQTLANKVRTEALKSKTEVPLLMGLQVPDPVFFCSIEAPSLSQTKLLEEALDHLQKEDPSLRVTADEDTGQTVLSGMGELHLEIIKDRILKEYKVDADLGPLQIAYRETCTTSSIHTLDIDKKIGDANQHVKITLSIEPEENYKFGSVALARTKENTENLNSIHRNVMKAVNHGINSALTSGPVLGFPVTNIKVYLHRLETGHKTSETIISSAAAQCIYQLLRNASCQLLEPFMDMEIITDENNSSSVLGDIARRRGNIIGINLRHDSKVINAECPLAELIGYSTSLRTLTSGTAVFSMEFSSYKLMNAYDQAIAIERVTGF